MSVSRREIPETRVEAASFGAAFFVAALVASIFPAIDWTRAIPGDLGDARFNSFILEHVYRWMSGRVPDLWSPPAFYPFEGTLAFSDTHFGSVATYALARGLGMQREAAYQFWFVVGASANYAAAYFLLRRLGYSGLASGFGAFLFACGLPTGFKSAHAQLVHRFAMPLAVHSLWTGVRRARATAFVWLAFFVAVQFLCSVYLGVFLVYLVAAFLLSYLLVGPRPSKYWWTRFVAGLRRGSRVSRWAPVAIALVASVAATSMLAAYARIGRLYGLKRAVADIDPMLPRARSYLYAPFSKLYSWLVDGSRLPMAHEHHMFLGFFAGAFFLFGVVLACRRKSSVLPRVAALALALLVVFTLRIKGGHSLYYVMAHVPGFSAVRAVTRIVLAMLLPVSILVATGADRIWLRLRIAKDRWVAAFFVGTVILGASVEVGAFDFYRQPVSEWVAHRDRNRRLVAGRLPRNPIVFVPSDGSGPHWVDELDGMVLAQDLGAVTLNGYSGNTPVPEWPIEGITSPCMDLSFRLDLYARAEAQHGRHVDVEALKRRVVGLVPPACSRLVPAIETMTPELARRLHLSVRFSGPDSAVVTIENQSDRAFSSRTRRGPVRVSYRFLTEGATPRDVPDFEARVDFAAAIPPGAKHEVVIHPIPPGVPGRHVLQASLVLEGVTWLHDLGMTIGATEFVIERRDAPAVP